MTITGLMELPQMIFLAAMEGMIQSTAMLVMTSSMEVQVMTDWKAELATIPIFGI